MSNAETRSGLKRTGFAGTLGAVVAFGMGVPTSWGATTPPAADDKVALVIGNATYEVFDALANPTNDAADMCAALKRVGFRTTCHANLRDRGEFLAQVQEFAAQLKPETQALFFYAGHAVQIRGENFLVPTGSRVTSPKDVDAQFVGMNDIFARLAKSPSRFQMVVLDACRNNPFVEQPRTASANPNPADSRSRAALLGVMEASNASDGLRAIKDAPAGTIVLYATASDDAAFDGRGRNGPLTKHLLAHIETAGINVEEMIKRVTVGVQTETLKGFGKRQTPFVYSSFTGSFCFAGCAEQVDAAELKRMEGEKAGLLNRLAEETKRANADAAELKRLADERAKRAADEAKRAKVFVTPSF